MNFKYYNYNSDIGEDINPNSENTIYIFASNKEKKYFNKKISRNYLSNESIFLTFSEFKEKLFIPDKIILREEKISLFFYKSIPDNIKKELKIENYYDTIDLSYNLIKLYSKLKEKKIDKLENLHKWQDKIYNYFEEIMKKLDENLEKNNFILPEYVNDFKYYNDDYIKDTEKIVFVNVLKYSDFDRELINTLDNSSINISFMLQIDKNDFNEKSLKINKITFPKEIKINYYENTDINGELLCLISEIEDSKVNSKSTEFIAYDIESIKYSNMIKKNEINFLQKEKFSKTKLYIFLTKIYDVLSSVIFKKGKIYIKIDELDKLLENLVAQKYFNINYEDYLQFIEIKNNKYRYINREYLKIITNETAVERKINDIIDFIEELYKCNNLKEIIVFLETNFNINKLDINKNLIFEDIFYKENIQKYYESITEILSIENMRLVTNWEEYFNKNKISEGLFKLILKYLKEKNIDKIQSGNSNYYVKNGEDISYYQVDKNVIFNINTVSLPKIDREDFFLTDKQKRELDIYNNEDEELYAKYTFLKNIVNGKEINIYGLNIYSEKKDRCNFIEELIQNGNINKIKEKFNDYDFINLIINEYNLEISSEKQIIINEKYFDLKKVNSNRDGIYLNYYDYKSILECPYKYYIENLSKLKLNNSDNEKKINSVKTIFYKTFEKILLIKQKNMLKNDFSITEEEILKNINISDESLKIEMGIIKYYEVILKNIILKLIINIFMILGEKYHSIQIKKINIKTKDLIELVKYPKNYLVNFPEIEIELENEIQNIYIVEKDSYTNDLVEFIQITSFLKDKNRSGENRKSINMVYAMDKNTIKLVDSNKIKLEKLDKIYNILNTKVYKTSEKEPKCELRCKYSKICRINKKG